MEQSEVILKMIETVSQDDTAKLDEIDARVLCYVGNHVYLKHDKSFVSAQFSSQGPAWTDYTYPCYTRSRDALKAIRPEGWYLHVDEKLTCDKTYSVRLDKFIEPDDFINKESAWLPTEELAELHAIIQAISYERSK